MPFRPEGDAATEGGVMPFPPEGDAGVAALLLPVMWEEGAVDCPPSRLPTIESNCPTDGLSSGLMRNDQAIVLISSSE